MGGAYSAWAGLMEVALVGGVVSPEGPLPSGWRWIGRGVQHY